MTANLTIGQLIIDPAGAALSPPVGKVTVIQKDYNHDIAIVHARNILSSNPALVTGTPVILNYGWLRANEFFYGYISHVNAGYQHGVATGVQYIDIVCIGASYSLKQGLGATYTNTQASAVVEQLASQSYLSGFIENDDPLWPSLSASNMSIWSFMVCLAQKLGWTFSVNKTNLKFLSTDAALNVSIPTMPTFFTAATAGSAETITNFTAYQGETPQIAGHTKANRVTSDINMSTGDIYTLTQPAYGGALGTTNAPATLTQYPTNQSAPDQNTATNLLQGTAIQNRFYIQATATLAGNTDVIQGTAINLTGLGTTNSGAWYVQEAVHTVTNTNYVINVTLGRDAINDNGLVPTQNSSVYINLANRYSLELSQIPKTILVQGVWRAASKAIIYA